MAELGSIFKLGLCFAFFMLITFNTCCCFSVYLLLKGAGDLCCQAS